MEFVRYVHADWAVGSKLVLWRVGRERERRIVEVEQLGRPSARGRAGRGGGGFFWEELGNRVYCRMDL